MSKHTLKNRHLDAVCSLDQPSLTKQLVTPLPPITIGLAQHQEGLLHLQLVLVERRFCGEKAHTHEEASDKVSVR